MIKEIEDIHRVVDELGYGIIRLTRLEIDLVTRQGPELVITMKIGEPYSITPDLLRQFLTAHSHRSGDSYTDKYRREAIR